MQKVSPFIIIIIIALILSAVSGSKFAWVLLILYLVYLVITKYNLLGKLSFTNIKSMPSTIDIKNTFGPKVASAKKFVTSIVILIIVIVIVAAAVVVVEAGETGVYSLFGRVKDKELSSGIHLINPLAKVTPMSIRTEEYTMSIVSSEGKKAGDDSIAALTKEGLSVGLDITVLYHLEENQASDVYKNVGLTYEEKIIRPTVRSAIREIIAQYNARDIYSEKRQEAAGKIYDVIDSQLADRGIQVEKVLLRNVELPPLLAQAIQDKLTAEQEAQKYDFILEKEKKEAERKVIEAQGQRDAQTIINQSLTTNYLYYLYINKLQDREGTIYVPISPSTGLPLFRGLGE